ncbi:hypothetical protein, partial [Vibrio splendidus]|uniref:hypothetical protein n=1 Tax=Vibrio splendidus TaxID=29497 RepID=UPI001A7E06EC
YLGRYKHTIKEAPTGAFFVSAISLSLSLSLSLSNSYRFCYLALCQMKLFLFFLYAYARVLHSTSIAKSLATLTDYVYF